MSGSQHNHADEIQGLISYERSHDKVFGSLHLGEVKDI